MSSSDDDTDNEYDEQELLVEFKKLISVKETQRSPMFSYALIESAYEIMATTVKDSQPHTCL
jgi:hypothetical protein